MLYPRSCIVMFAKQPVGGKVKTRLIPLLGAEGALDLHKKLLSYGLETLKVAKLCPYELWVSENPQDDFFLSCCEPAMILQQQGEDLGLRMQHAAQAVLKRYQHVVIVGSDCPSITADYLKQALEFLAKGADVVLGPAIDGGYVLLGMGKVDSSVFKGVEWGSPKVLEQTRERLRKLAWKWQELPVLWDVDRPEDLKQLETIDLLKFNSNHI